MTPRIGVPIRTAFMDELRAARRRLGLGDHPTRSDIVSAYRAAAKRCHPDHGGDAQAFAELEEAYRRALSGIQPPGHELYLRIVEPAPATLPTEQPIRRQPHRPPVTKIPGTAFADLLRREMDRLAATC